MTTAGELLKQGRKDEIWQKYCGFIDLSLTEFMDIQKRLLMDQLDLLSKCELGQKLLGGNVLATLEEFRQQVPLTTYQDYIPYLSEKQEGTLPVKPYTWARTSGRMSEYAVKWIPYSKGLYSKFCANAMAMFAFGSSDRRGVFVFDEGDFIFAAIAPPPYLTGAVVAPGLLDHFPFKYLPPLDQAEAMDFQTRIAEGFKLALQERIDIFYGLASVLVKVGEQFEQGSGSMNPKLLLHPKILFRVVKGLLKSKLAGRGLLPKDLWSVKAIAAGGTDMEIFRDKIQQYWGKAPVEAYGGTEIGLLALQTWGTGLTFVPDVSFLEFIPLTEHLKLRQDPAYQPTTCLLNEVTVGEVYEIVVTNFHGGVFVRYRPGDLIKIVARRDEKHQIDLPQMVFYSRSDDVIDLEGFTRLTERNIAWSLENAKIGYVDWTASKEVDGTRPILHLYLEPKAGELRNEMEIGAILHEALKGTEPEYGHWEVMMNGRPPKVTLLSAGTFQRYMLEKQTAGAELSHLKPIRMNPLERNLSDLVRLSDHH